MSKTRDMTKAQFDRECAKRGFVRQPFLGYYKLGDTNLHVCAENAGPRRRSQIAYLIREHERWLENRYCSLQKGTP